MFIFINPWNWYDKEDMPTINYEYRSLKEINKSMRNLLLIMTFITLFLWVLISATGFLIAGAPAASIVTIVTILFWISYIKDIWKEKTKHLEN